MADTLVKGAQLMTLHPLSLEQVNLRSRSSSHFHFLQCLRQWSGVFRDTKDVLMISNIDSTTEQLPTFRICSCDHEILATHNIPLKASRNQAVNMLTNGYKHFARKVPALLATMELVFEMYSGRSVLSKELC